MSPERTSLCVILAQAPSFMKLGETARFEYRKGQTLVWDDRQGRSESGPSKEQVSG